MKGYALSLSLYLYLYLYLSLSSSLSFITGWLPTLKTAQCTLINPTGSVVTLRADALQLPAGARWMHAREELLLLQLMQRDGSRCPTAHT